MRARHRLSKFLLRHGRIWRAGKAWTLAHERWLRTQRFTEPALQTTYDHYRAVLASRDAQLEAIEADLVVWQDRAPFAEQVARLAAYRGVTRLGALHLAAEVGDWRRFARASAFMGFCGLVPSEYSSGQVTRRGHITKAGNRHLRTQLAWVGLGLPAPPQCRRPAGEPTAGPGPPGGGPSLDRPAATVRTVPTPARPQALDQHRRHRHRPGAGRVPVGRDGSLSRDHPTALCADRPTRRPSSSRRAGAPPSQDRSPFVLCPPGWPETMLVRGPFLRIADLWSRPANIRVAACRSMPPRRVVPATELGRHQPCSDPPAAGTLRPRPAPPARSARMPSDHAIHQGNQPP
jgi:hypothetical protein